MPRFNTPLFRRSSLTADLGPPLGPRCVLRRSTIGGDTAHVTRIQDDYCPFLLGSHRTGRTSAPRKRCTERNANGRTANATRHVRGGWGGGGGNWKISPAPGTHSDARRAELFINIYRPDTYARVCVSHPLTVWISPARRLAPRLPVPLPCCRPCVVVSGRRDIPTVGCSALLLAAAVTYSTSPPPSSLPPRRRMRSPHVTGVGQSRIDVVCEITTSDVTRVPNDVHL